MYTCNLHNRTLFFKMSNTTTNNNLNSSSFHTFRNVYFGVADERLNILQNLSSAVWETIKLNLVTAVLIIMGDVLRLLHTYHTRCHSLHFLHAMHVVSSLYFLSNPLLYMVVMTDLRQCYTDVVCKCRRRRPDVVA